MTPEQARSEAASLVANTRMIDPTLGEKDARRKSRSSLFITAVLQAPGQQASVKVRNMSSYGAMIESTLSLPLGTKIELVRGRLLAKGEIVWTVKNRSGMRFAPEISVQDWLAPPAKAEQQRVDEIVSLTKAGVTLPTQDNSDILHRLRPSDGQLADDLGVVIKLIHELDDDLASSAETVARHEQKLQNLDIALQMLRAIAQQFKCGSSDQASNSASLSNLRVASGQALGAPHRP